MKVRKRRTRNSSTSGHSSLAHSNLSRNENANQQSQETSATARSRHSFAGISVESPHGVLAINGPDKSETKQTPAPKPKAPAAPKCPTDIQVVQVETVQDKDIGKDGYLTALGGLALMEVSDPSSKSWDGVEIQEKLKLSKNDCGARARKHACKNESGENVSFKVGAESKFLGQSKLPAAKNRFYDVHVFATKEASITHELGKTSCEIQCEQSYFCDGNQIGPDFQITYTLQQDTVAKAYDVSRVELGKAAKTKAAPAAPTGGGKP